MTDQTLTTTGILEAMAHGYDGFSPQLQVAARYLLDNPTEIAVSSMRQVADDAEVKPNTLVRLARALDFDGYDDLRRHFQSDVTRTGSSFPSKARWLRSLAASGRYGALVSQMAGASMANVEQVFADADANEFKTVADLILAARRTAVLGVGTAQPLAQNFCYVGGMVVPNLVAIPTNGGLAIDDVARMAPGDVLLSMTFSPYRVEIVDATREAADRGVVVVAITDSRTAPIALMASHTFIVPTETPQYFSSAIGAVALLETLLAFMAADTPSDAATAIEEFHQRRREAGVYQ
ncbi:MurR/RpiR family transcriptional regulator [soil metagenome]